MFYSFNGIFEDGFNHKEIGEYRSEKDYQIANTSNY